jgi:pyridoxal phosphate enzyme (YggS family)
MSQNKSLDLNQEKKLMNFTKNLQNAALDSLEGRYQQVVAQLAAISQASSQTSLRASATQLIVVTKTQPLASIQHLLNLGHRVFGENRWQEGKEHWEAIKPQYPDLALHFIGALQSNKAAEVVSLFDCIHSLDRSSLAIALAKAMQQQNRFIPCFIQVNTGEESQKSGIFPSEAADFIRYCREELHLPIIGLMTVPPQDTNPAPHFAFLRKLAREHYLLRLSMGMSEDWQTAVRLGATDIRLGTAIFGARKTAF